MDDKINEFNVLFLDDDKAFTKLANIAFKKTFSVLTANSVEEAFELMTNNNVGIVVSDFNMPEMNGIEFLKIIWDDYPNVKRVLISGALDLDIAFESINEAHIDLIVQKPWEYEDFKDKISKLMKDFIEKYEGNLQIEDLKKREKQLKSEKYRYTDNLLDTLASLQETKKISEFATHFLSVLEGVQSLTLVNIEFYLDIRDPVILDHAFQYLSDIEVIANQYDQKGLSLYVFLLRAYIHGISENYKESRLNFLGARALYQWIKDNFIVDTMLEALEQFPIKEENFNIVGNPMIPRVLEMHIKRLLTIKIGDLINITESIFNLISNISSSISYFVVIRKDIPIYDKNAQNQDIEASLISGFVIALSQFLKETVKGSGDIDTISHNRGVILIHRQNEINYVLFLSINDIRFRIALREFATHSSDIVNALPENTTVSLSERKSLNKIADKILGKF